VPRDGEISVLL